MVQCNGFASDEALFVLFECAGLDPVSAVRQRLTSILSSTMENNEKGSRPDPREVPGRLYSCESTLFTLGVAPVLTESMECYRCRQVIL